MFMVKSPLVLAETSSASFSICSVKARRLPQTDTFHLVAAITSIPATEIAALASKAIFVIFLITSLTFTLYDCIVQYRQKKVVTSATRTDAIVNALFPAAVRDRLLEQAVQEEEKTPLNKLQALSSFGSARNLNKSPMEPQQKLLSSKPIADLVRR